MRKIHFKKRVRISQLVPRLARRSPRQPLIGAVFAVHARENRIFKSEGDPPLTTPPVGW